MDLCPRCGNSTYAAGVICTFCQTDVVNARRHAMIAQQEQQYAAEVVVAPDPDPDAEQLRRIINSPGFDANGNQVWPPPQRPWWKIW
jgi:hypothetical protein